MLRPLRPKPVRTRQGTVTTADDKGVDTVTNEVEGGLSSTLEFTESGATSSSDQSSTDRGETTDVVPANL